MFAGTWHGRVQQWVCRALIDQFARQRFSFFVGCAFRRRELPCRAGGLYASVVVPPSLPPKVALARRTLWLVRRCSLAVLFPESPGDGRRWCRIAFG